MDDARREREYVVYVIGIERELACFPDRTMGGGREREQTREGERTERYVYVVCMLRTARG